MNRKVYVQGSQSEQEQLRVYIRQSQDARARQRAEAILWSMEGRDRVDLASLFHVKPDTISLWFKRWDPNDLSKLSDEQRSGRPPMLSEAEKKAS